MLNKPSRRRLIQFASVGVFVAGVGAGCGARSAPSAGAVPPPSPRIAAKFDIPPPDVSSYTIPPDVQIPADFPFTQNPISFFDDYAWKAFIALIWPAQPGQRGMPDPTASIDDTTHRPRVFETYKATWEIYNEGQTPASWNQPGTPDFNPLGLTSHFGDLTIASFTKFSDLGQADFGQLVGPLIAQNRRFVRYLAAVNETLFNKVIDNGLYNKETLSAYLAKQPNQQVHFDDQSIAVKSAWMEVTPGIDASRYYTKSASVKDPRSGQPTTLTLALIGLHIVQKTHSRPQWIWATFEHVDNVPPPDRGSLGRYVLNDGDPTHKMPSRNPYDLDHLDPIPAPYNVSRLRGIDSRTATTNDEYHAKLAANSVWRNYELVMTQWPRAPDASQIVPANQAVTSDLIFPGGKDGSAFANTTMETFDQTNNNDPTDISISCMGCHNAASSSGAPRETDFIWSLPDHAGPNPRIPKALLNKLRTLLRP